MDQSGTGPVAGAAVCTALAGLQLATNIYSTVKAFDNLRNVHEQNRALVLNDKSLDDCEQLQQLTDLDNQFQRDVLSLIAAFGTPNLGLDAASTAACLAALLTNPF